MGLVECHQFPNVHIGHAVTVGEHEGLITYVLSNAFHTSASHGIKTSIGHGDAPRHYLGVVDNHLIFAAGKIVGDI